MNTEQQHEFTSDVTAQSRSQRRGSLKLRLLAWFLAVALVPLTVVSVVSYSTAKESLRRAAFDSVAKDVEQRAAFINNWFRYRLIDLESQATSVSNMRFLQELRDAFKTSGKEIGEFIKSYRWTAIADERSEDLKTFHKLFGYYDVFLIDTEGNILFTVAGESNLGTNLFNDSFAETRFEAACRKALESGRPVFSDLEYYAPSNDAIAAFLAEVIVDEDGEKIGVFAIQISSEQIQHAMRSVDEDGTDIRAYVIGSSHDAEGVTLRSSLDAGALTDDAALSRHSQRDGSSRYLNQFVDTEQTRLWSREHGSDAIEAAGTTEIAFVYDGPDGKRVLGIHKDFSIAGVNWAFIAEIPEGIAFAPAAYLKNLMVALVLATGVVVAVIAMVITRRIVRPIVELSGAARLVAQGDLTQVLDSDATDEIGDLARCFNWMVSNLSKLFGDLEARGKELEEQAERLREANMLADEQTARANSMAAAAEMGSQSKSEFLANMSHEIRTPMTAILGFTENMLEPDLSDEEKLRAIHTIRRNGEHLLQIINDILDISKIEAGRLEVECIHCSPVQLVTEVKALMQVRADAKNLYFVFESAGPIPDTIESDPTRLKQILVNLIGNAIKFTETGGVRLVTRLVNDGAEPEMQFEVLDTGIGMNEEQMGNLFQAFSQADTSTTRNFGGTGLGLMLSKRLAEMLGGDITVESALGEGSRFRLTVTAGPLEGVKMLEDPLSATVVADSAYTVAQVTSSGLHGVRILLAEDGPDNQRLISFVLKKVGADVTVEENGQLALDAALAARDEGNPFDVILMDMQMPVMDGYEATGQLRQKGYTGPIIALTAHAMESDRQKCLDAGCDDYATKPIDRVTLIGVIQKYSENRRMLVPQENVTSDILVSDLTDDDMLELVEEFVSELPERLAAIERAVGERDLATLGTLSHQLKGAAGGHGFPSITAAAGLLESSARVGEELETLTEQARSLADLCHRAQDGVVQRRPSGDVTQTPESHDLSPTDCGSRKGIVLVADDEASTRRLFRELLERDGFQVHEACDGIEALAKVADIHPHVILMDVDMPNMDGLECTRALKVDPALRDIPVIIVSGKTDRRDVRAGLEAGAQEYITKPVQHDEFLARVRAMNQMYQGDADLLHSNAVRDEQARAMSILFDLSRSLAVAANLDAIVAHAASATAELMNSRRASIMLPDDTGQNLYVAGAIGIDEEFAAEIRVPVGGAIAGRVFATGEATICNSHSDPLDRSSRYESDFFVSAPLVSQALAVPDKVVGVLNVTERHDGRPYETHEIEYFDLVCNMTALAIERFQSGQARAHAHAAIVIGLAKLAEHRDSDTGKHLERVTQYALLLARELRKSPRHASTIDDRFLSSLEQAMPLHDIGKVAVSDAILLKPGRLSESEFAAMKRHAEVGANAIQSMIERAPEAEFLPLARDIAHCHHEWYDGNGYPRGLAGDRIPLAARIAAVADVYDALTTKRPYKEAFPHEEAVGIIRDASTSHFDPQVVDVFIHLERGFAELAQELRDESDSNPSATDRELVVGSTGMANPLQ